MNLKASIRHYPATAFVLCAFVFSVAVSFAPIGDADKFMILAALLVPIPTLVALALASLTGGIRSFLRETFSGRWSLRWVLIAAGIALVARVAVSVLALLTGAISSVEMSAPVLPLIIMIYVFALLEEVGWRGFAVRRLVKHRSPIAALLITGIPWSIIHIFFYMAQAADVPTLLQVFMLNFALTIMVTWVYLRSGQIIWAAVILHGSQSVFSVLNTNIAPDLSLAYSVISYSVIALVILAADWRLWFGRPAQTSTNPTMQSTSLDPVQRSASS